MALTRMPAGPYSAAQERAEGGQRGLGAAIGGLVGCLMVPALLATLMITPSPRATIFGASIGTSG